MANNTNGNSKIGEWEYAMEAVTNRGAVFSNKALRKYFKIKLDVNPASKTHNDLADIYGQIVSAGRYFEQKGTLDEGGYFYSSVKNIADELSLDVRRVRKMIAILREEELIMVKETTGEANRFKVNIDVFLEVINHVKFKYRRG